MATVHSQSLSKPRKRHHRTNSGSPRNSACSRPSSNRASLLIDTETQTDYMEISETDLSPNNHAAIRDIMFLPDINCSNQPQRVILQEVQGSFDGENSNGNAVQIHYMSQHKEPCKYLFKN